MNEAKGRRRLHVGLLLATVHHMLHVGEEELHVLQEGQVSCCSAGLVRWLDVSSRFSIAC